MLRSTLLHANEATKRCIQFLNNSNFSDYIPLIYPPELEIKETTDTDHSVSFLDLHLEFDDSG